MQKEKFMLVFSVCTYLSLYVFFLLLCVCTESSEDIQIDMSRFVLFGLNEAQNQDDIHAQPDWM